MFTRLIWELIAEFGALTCWIFKGFKGTFDDQNAENNYNINLGVGMVSFLIFAGIIGSIATFC